MIQGILSKPAYLLALLLNSNAAAAHKLMPPCQLALLPLQCLLLFNLLLSVPLQSHTRSSTAWTNIVFYSDALESAFERDKTYDIHNFEVCYKSCLPGQARAIVYD